MGACCSSTPTSTPKDPNRGLNAESARDPSGGEEKALRGQEKKTAQEDPPVEPPSQEKKEPNNQREKQREKSGKEAPEGGKKKKDKKGKRGAGDKKKGKVIYAEKDEDVRYENVQESNKKMTKKDVEFIIDSFTKHFLFVNLNEDELEDVVTKMFYCVLKKDNYVFKQGDDASCFFIIDSGKIQVEIDGDVKKTISNGEYFGELALLYNAPRSASIKTVSDSYFWAIDRKTFKKVVEDITTKNFRENRTFLDKVNFFDSMTNEQKDAIAGSLISQKYDKNKEIVNKGDEANSYYIIKKGTVSCINDSGEEVRELAAGDSFGENALFKDSRRGLAVIAKEEGTSVLALSRDALQNILGSKIDTVINSNWCRWGLEKDVIFSKLTNIQTEKIIKSVEFKSYSQGDVILKKNQPLSHLAVVINGDCKYESETISKGVAFSNKFIYPDSSLNKPLSSDLTAISDNTKIALLSIEAFHNIIGGTMEKAMVKNEESHEKKMIIDDDKFRDAVSSLTLDDLVHIKKLGEGQFGHVFLVRAKGQTKLYALKAVSKAQIIEQNLEKHTLQEKSVLKKVNFKFIMRMYRTFRDDNYVYFLLSFVRGLELFEVIRKMDLLNNDESKFYIGTMILAVEYLHRRKIVYRDIKPENIMVDEDGYLKLIDMGTAKILKEKNGMYRTNTILGTPHYMAPEILHGKGYSLLVDLWSIGITLYEFMCGLVPFGEDCEDPYEVYQMITTQNLSYPPYFLVKENKLAKKMMEKLLNRNPDARLGGSYAALKAHPWFENFDWDKLHDRELKSPYCPPKHSIISDTEIDKIAGMKIPVVEEINKTVGMFKKSRHMKASVPNWDKDFEI